MPDLNGPVIVVEDDDAVRNSLKFVLKLEGMNVHAYPGGDALLAENGLPAGGCLVVDYYMPGMMGLDLVGTLRDRDVHIPAILITAKSTDDMRVSAARAGVQLVLEKPLEDSCLMEGIRGALKGDLTSAAQARLIRW